MQKDRAAKIDVISIYRNASSWWDEQPSVTLKNLPQTEFFILGHGEEGIYNPGHSAITLSLCFQNVF